VTNDNSSCSFTASQTEQNTYNCKTAHIVNILILCTSTEHVFYASAIVSHSIIATGDLAKLKRFNFILFDSIR